MEKLRFSFLRKNGDGNPLTNDEYGNLVRDYSFYSPDPKNKLPYPIPDLLKREEEVVDEVSVKKSDKEVVLELDKSGAVALPSQDSGLSVPQTNNGSCSQDTSLAVGKKSPDEFFGGLFGGGKATVDGNIADLMKADKDLEMKTDIRDPLVMTLVDMVGFKALNTGYSKTSEFYAMFGSYLRKNMVSFNRGGRKEAERIYTARRQEELESGADLEGKEKVLGKRGGR